MGWADIVNQKLVSYIIKSKSRKGTKVGFSYWLDTIQVNVRAIFALSDGKYPKKLNSFDFGLLCLSFCLDNERTQEINSTEDKFVYRQ